MLQFRHYKTISGAYLVEVGLLLKWDKKTDDVILDEHNDPDSVLWRYVGVLCVQPDEYQKLQEAYPNAVFSKGLSA